VVEASGQIEPAVSVDISSDVIGKIIAMGAEEGDVVKAGQFLIQIDPAQFEQRAAGLEAELATAQTSLLEVQASLAESRANLAIRKADFERDGRLFREKLIAASMYEASQAAHEMAQAQVDLTRARIDSARNRILQARASLAVAEDQLSRCRIVAPMDGVIIRKNAEVGEVAISGTLNNQGSLLMTIADLSVMETEVDVDETDVVHVEMGQEVEVSLDAFPARKFKGRVTRIGNSAIQMAAAPGQRQSADYKVEVTLLETDSKIRPGLSATARITTAVREDVLSVPIQSLVVREIGGDDEDEDADTDAGEAPEDEPAGEGSPAAGVAMAASLDEGAGDSATGEAAEETGGPSVEGEAPEDGEVAEGDDGGEEKTDEEEVEGVFVVRDGKAVFVPVSTGIAGEKYFEVLEGLEPGDEVVSGNFSALRNLKDGDPVKHKKTKDKKSRS